MKFVSLFVLSFVCMLVGDELEECIDLEGLWPWGTESYVVKSGETFTSIADECCVPVDFLKKLNSTMTDFNEIRNGDIVVIPSLNFSQLAHAFMHVESRHNPFAKGDWNRAVGVLQIWPIMVDEVNRLTGYNKFEYDDRKDMSKSIAMFKVKMTCPTRVQTVREAVKRWNPRADPARYIRSFRTSHYTHNVNGTQVVIYYGTTDSEFFVNVSEHN